MRRGSVSERYVKCNKAGCACADRDDARHGPYYSITRVVKGRTKSRWLDTEQARQVREQVSTGQKFRELVEAYWQACEQWADAQLEDSKAASQEAAKKGLQSGARSRNRHRDRSALRHGRRRLGLRGHRDGCAPHGDACGGPRRGTTTECRYLGPCRPDVTLRVRAVGALRRPAWQELRECAGAFKAGARLLPLRAVRGGLCPRDRVLGLEGGSLSPGVLRMAGLVGAMVSFEEGHELLHELAGVNVPTKHVERAPKRWGVRSPRTRSSWSSRRGQTNHWRRRCIWGWMVRVCRCAKRSW